MNNFARKYKKFLRVISYFIILVGFLGMLFLTYTLIENVINIFISKEAVAGVALVLPVKAKGVFYVPFFYWIISIFILAIVHEFSHGIMARLYKIKLKSTGFAFLCLLVPIQPLAFVEPDENKIKKLPTIKQLSIFAAGPFANIILAFLILLLLGFVVIPSASHLIQEDGIEIVNIIKESAAEKAGLSPGEIIVKIDNTTIKNLKDFENTLNLKKPNESIILLTNKKTYNITLGQNPNNKSKVFLGVNVKQHNKIKEELKQKYLFLPSLALWFVGLLYWLYLLNLGVGLFNLIPIGPIDGGRMVYAILSKKYKKEKAIKIFSFINIFFILLILINFLCAFM